MSRPTNHHYDQLDNRLFELKRFHSHIQLISDRKVSTVIFLLTQDFNMIRRVDQIDDRCDD